MSSRYLDMLVVENSTEARMWNKLMCKLQADVIGVTSPLILQRGISGGSMLSIKSGYSKTSTVPFQVYASGALKVKIKGGRIIWHDQDFDVDDSSEITVPASTSAFKVWIDLADEFAPVPVFNSGSGGWTGYPDQPHPPARRYMLLAEIDSGATSITTITKYWNGGDIIWPTIYGFHL